MDLTPVIQPFGPGTEDVRITDMTGRHLAAALEHYPAGDPCGRFLRNTQRKFLAAGGKSSDRVASKVDLSPAAVIGLIRGERD